MPARRYLDSWNTYSDQAPSWLGTDFTKPAHLLFLLSSISGSMAITTGYARLSAMTTVLRDRLSTDLVTMTDLLATTTTGSKQ